MSDSEKDQRLNQQQRIPRETELRCPDPKTYPRDSSSPLARFLRTFLTMLRRTKNDRI